MTSRIDSMVGLACMHIKSVIREGSTVCDATCGNGYDTAFMATLVGKGKVYSFDIQREALEATKALLARNGLTGNVKLIHDGHENMDKHINEPIQAVMFNLGYLPGGNHEITSKKGTTLKALDYALNILAVGGRASIVAYTGHPGGLEERDAVNEYVSNLEPSVYTVISTRLLNRSRPAPELFLVQKVGE
ncbi:MAG TPA: class I SAM-dependent methyltransferase [Clostridia bacterium]|nr:class I SAM-dependent methyltransferase [Clostridia bacterium]